ncbi:rhamnulokinase [Paenibacillus donghaensis]|uniref:Rhamnulokinase n=1 Tax=Paenibacillus donghaensis TaxID=414771 RepID=A0A2Z2KAJ2_9BACL|nr:rhamnulokinase family protein [Paenibacillus donghaensis]ASA19930.1 rhamnulokinase [Paenibacillus donghaensis]
MGEPIKLLAIDLGASSGRVILGKYDGIVLSVEEIHRFDNTPVSILEHLHWDVLRLFHEMKTGIRAAAREHDQLRSLSVDTWGVDYGFIDDGGRLLYSPHHYRDQRTVACRSELEGRVPPAEQFNRTGNQPALINTVYQLFADWQQNPALAGTADTLLMMPDLFHYLFSGIKAAETTIWSTSGLLDAASGKPSAELLERLGLPAALIPQQVPAGTVIGQVLPALQEELGIGPMKVISGASHDTASAVASIPYVNKEGAAFISCGTWSLVGMETSGPVINDKGYEFGFTNERCFGGTNRLLKNITGLWILQETGRCWQEAGEPLSHIEMVRLAKAAGPAMARIDPNDPLFGTPGDMPERISQYCRWTQQQIPQTKGELIRLILESLAFSYSDTLKKLEELTGERISVIHMVGGGIQNELLCQLTADITGREIIAGPVEASSIGNLIVQLVALGKLDSARAGELVTRSFPCRSYQPAGGISQ